MSTQHSPAPRRTLGHVVRALLSLLILTAVVVGLPAVLAWVTPLVWAQSHHALAHLLDQQDTGAVAVLALVAVGWAGWAVFVAATLRETAAQLSGRSWRAPRGLGTSQRAAAALIGSILVLLPAGTALATPAQATPAAVATHRSPAAEPSAASTASSSAAHESQERTYTVRQVRPAESLWSIAERELGDGERWRQIAALNEGRTMANGQVFTSTGFLQPGWTLRLPGPKAAPERQSPEEQEKQRTVTVQAGESLSGIAERELGGEERWPEAFHSSTTTTQPDGLPRISDPDVIFAGQQVTLPSSPGDAPTTAPPPTADKTPPAPPASPTPSKPDTSRPDRPAPDQEQPPATDTGSGQVPPTRAPEPSRSITPPTSDTPAPSVSAPSSAQPEAEARPAAATSSRPLHLQTVLGAGALLAAGVTGALTLRRVLQRRRRKPGELPARAETTTAEAKLAAASEPRGAEELDRALRTMAARTPPGQEVPRIRAARIGTRSMSVLADDSAAAPRPPFTSSLGDSGWWTLPADAELLPIAEAREVPSPAPGLVTLGSSPDATLILANLALAPALLLDGNPVHITEVCTSLALEFAMSPWADNVEIITVGFGQELPGLLPTSRIGHMQRGEHALKDLAERLLEAHQLDDNDRQPYLLLCASSLNPDTAWQLADLLDKAGSTPVTVIAPAGSAATSFPEAPILNASATQPQHVDLADSELTMQRLEHDAYEDIVQALSVTNRPPEPAEGAWQDVPEEAAPQRAESAAAATTTTPTPQDVPGTGARVTATPLSENEDVFPALLTAATAPTPSPVVLPSVPAPAPFIETGHAASSPASDYPQRFPDPGLGAATALPHAADGGDLPSPAFAKTDTMQVGAAVDLQAPEIKILGRIEVSGVQMTGHGPREAQLAALLYFRPGRTWETLCEAMDPIKPWSKETLNSRLRGLRRALGNDPSGTAYVPRRTTASDPFLLLPGIRCDWTRFQSLAERALPQGPAGVAGLEAALGLVRGRPFGSAPLPWAEPFQQEILTRVVDVCHTVATYRMAPGTHHDLDAARRAIALGLDVDDTAELLYRDWMRIEHAGGNRAGLHTAIARLQRVNRDLDICMEAETEALVRELLSAGSGASAHSA